MAGPSPPLRPTNASSPPRGLLATLDRSRTRGYHWRTVVVAGMGFFSDAYDLFVISLVLPMLGYVYYGSTKVPGYEGAAVAATALFGAVAGQLLFGYLADRLGRKKVYALTLSVMAVAAVGSALSVPAFGLDTLLVLAIWRFVLGMGVGGDYPLSATIMSEYANVRNRGRQVATVFAMQGAGLLAGALVTLGVLLALPSGSVAALDLSWRIILGLGAVPAVLTIYFRTRIAETPRFSLTVEGKVAEAAKTVETVTGERVSPGPAPRTTEPSRVPFSRFLTMYAPLLFGTAASWFLVDTTFYSTNIFNPIILTGIGFANSSRAIHPYLMTLAEGQILITLVASIPGYFAAVALIDRLGRRALQYVGFGVMALAFFLLSTLYDSLGGYVAAIFGIYAVTFFFTNMGPNTTTFVLPSEVYPTQFRGRGHGISAASGKLGAALVTFLFPTLTPLLHLPGTFALLGLFAFLGFVITLAVIPEPAGRSLEDVSREDELTLVVERFSTQLDTLASYLRLGTAELKELLTRPGFEQGIRVARIRAIEHQADEEVHKVFVNLNNKRMRATVRSDVGSLTGHLDDIMDGIEGVAARVKTYHLVDGDEGLARFADLVEECVAQVAVGVDALDELLEGRTETLQKAIVEVNRIENEADDLLRDRLEMLFTGTRDPLEVIKMKDFYERLEVITDRCEDVTDVFKDLIVRYMPGA